MNSLVGFQRLPILEAAENGHVDGVLIFGPGGQRAVENELVLRHLTDAERLAERQLVLGERAGLVGAQHVNAGQLFDRRQAADDGLSGRKEPRAHGHGHRKHCRHGHRDGRHREHQHELERGQQRIATEHGHAEDENHQGDGDDDQVVADLQNRALEMADRVRLRHQPGRLAKIGVGAGGVDEGIGLTLADDRPGKQRLSHLARDRERLAGQRRLIHLYGILIEQSCIGRHDVAEPHADDVARNERARLDIGPSAVPPDPGAGREPRLQCGDRIAGLVLFPETDPGVGEQQHEDDDEIGPMPDDGRKNGRNFDHPRDRSPEIAEELQKRAYRLLGDFIGPVLGQAVLGLGLAQALRMRTRASLRARRAAATSDQLPPRTSLQVRTPRSSSRPHRLSPLTSDWRRRSCSVQDLFQGPGTLLWPISCG